MKPTTSDTPPKASGDDMTLEILAANAGISVRDVARRWPV